MPSIENRGFKSRSYPRSQSIASREWNRRKLRCLESVKLDIFSPHCNADSYNRYPVKDLMQYWSVPMDVIPHQETQKRSCLFCFKTY